MTLFDARGTLVENDFFLGNPSEGRFDKQGGDYNVCRSNAFQGNQVSLEIINQWNHADIDNVATQIYENVFFCTDDSVKEALRLLSRSTGGRIYNDAFRDCIGIAIRSLSGLATECQIYNNVWPGRQEDSPTWVEGWSGDARAPDSMDFDLSTAGRRFQETRCEPGDREYGSLST